MGNGIVKIKGNLHLEGIENHPSYITMPMIQNYLSDNGITLSSYHCDDLPEGVVVMEFSDFVEKYKGCSVEVEGKVEFILKTA